MSDTEEDMDTSDGHTIQQPSDQSPAEVNQPMGTPQVEWTSGALTEGHAQQGADFTDLFSANAGSPLMCPTELVQVNQPMGTPQVEWTLGALTEGHAQKGAVFPDLFSANAGSPLMRPTELVKVNQPMGTPQEEWTSGSLTEVTVQKGADFPDPFGANAGAPLMCPTELHQTADGDAKLPPDSENTAESAITSPQYRDEGVFTLSLTWPGKLPPKPEKVLQLSLQAWFNKNLNMECTVVKVFNDGKAVIKIESPPVITLLKTKLCGQTLTKKSESISILSVDPTSAKLKKQLDNLSEIEPHRPVPSGAQGGPGLTASCSVSLLPFWYASIIDQEKLLEIQKENGVLLEPEITVTFKAVQKNGDPHKATKALTDLMGSVVHGTSVVPRKNVDEDQWRDALDVSKNRKNRLLLTVSPDKVLAWGPKKSRDVFTECLNAAPQTNPTTSMEEEESALQDTPIKMTIKDSPLEKGLTLEKSYWEEMTTSHSQKFKDIQTTFNVSFIGTDDGPGEVQVKARYRAGENLSMETHAISALLRLYQKTATCLLKLMDGDNESEETTNGFEKLKTEDGATAADKQEENCPICLGPLTNKKRLECKHEFCEDCLRKAKENIGPICPVCRKVFGMIEGNQPEGKMMWTKWRDPLPGFPKCGQIAISYDIPSGIQTEKHPNPGRHYFSVHRTAYLPDNREGNEVLHLLKRAFDQRLIFTIGTSRTTGMDNQVTWNDIHHKTSPTGGPHNFGYPDQDYLSRVKEELKAKGIE